MNTGDIVIYDRFGDRFASVAPTMKEEEQGVGLIIGRIYENSTFDSELEGMNWTKILTDDGVVKEMALCYLIDPKEVIQ